MINQIKDLLSFGLPLIPLCSHDHRYTSEKHNTRCKCPGKTPLIKDWQTKTETTMNEFQGWISSFKTFNIGLPLGNASGYCGIDIDGEQGIALLQEMSKGDLPGTWEFTTGAGHRLIYKIPAGIITKKYKEVGDGTHQECAILCDGQQTVIPPSIHHTGTKYEWVEGRSPWDMDCAMAPVWLIDLIKTTEIEKSTPGKVNTINLENEFGRPSVGNFDDEFAEDDVSYEIPDDVLTVNRNVKLQSQEKFGKTGHKITVTDEMLTQRIPEGARDDTMTAIVGHYCANRDLRRLGTETIFNICWEHNLKYCDPPLDQEAIRAKVSYFLSAELSKDNKFKKEAKIVFEPTVIAQKVLDKMKERGVYLHYDQFSKAYYYTTVHYGPWEITRNSTLISKWIREVLLDEGQANWDKRSYVEEVRHALEEHFAAPYKEVDDFDLGAHADELCKYIVVSNGMVDWQTGDLLAWDPKIKTTIAFDVEYDPDEECPRFESYMEAWLPDESVRMVVQEYLGLCLIPNTNFRKAMFFYGKGKNGKSILLEFLQGFFGKNASTLSYDALFQRFGPANLKNKIVNIFDDTTVSFAKETSIVKNLIAGGQISGEFKGKDYFTFTNVARLIYSSQETPRTSDTTVAWYDRWFFVKFPNTFRPSNKIKIEMQTALAEEKSGIFNWMLDGLRRLMENDEFTESAELDYTGNQYRSQNDNVVQFISSMCTTQLKGMNNENHISLTKLYEVYQFWVTKQQLKPVSKKVFKQRILDMGYTEIKGTLGGKSNQTYFDELSLDPYAEDYMENTLEIAVILSMAQ